MRSFACIILMIAFFQSGKAYAENWFPLEVDVWDPPFNAELERRRDTYVPLESASRDWRICVSIPHLKDAYWVAVNFALVDEARRLGIRLRVNEAGGYTPQNLEIQRQQIRDCMASGADGLIVSGISTDGVNDLVEGYLTEGKPVIDLINWISAEGITARAAVTYWDNGYQAGRFLLEHTGGVASNVIWLPGPEGPGWSGAGDQGFSEALAGSDVTILETLWGDTGRATQAELIEEALARFGSDIDYIVGTTVSAEAAVEIVKSNDLEDEIGVLAYYYGPGVHTGIRRGNILAAPTDKQGLQARLAVDIIIRALEGEEHLQHVGPIVEVIDREGLRAFDETTSIPPRGFRPTFSVDDWGSD